MAFLAIILEKNGGIKINFLCILLFYEFLMYFFVFLPFVFVCFFGEICGSVTERVALDFKRKYPESNATSIVIKILCKFAFDHCFSLLGNKHGCLDSARGRGREGI